MTIIEQFTEKDIKRFWSKVDVKSEDECWEWMAGDDGNGYGVIRINNKNVKAHRFSYTINIGVIFDKLFVCHSCDNPSCVNPKHLWLGTNKDNSQDRDVKGRGNHPKGVAHGRTSLSENDIIYIRETYSKGNITQKELAKQFGIVHSVVSYIVRGATWKNVAGKITKWENAARSRSKLNKSQVKEIKMLLQEKNITQVEIAKTFNINRRTISAINKNIIWKDVVI